MIQALCFTVWRRGVCGPFYAHSPTFCVLRCGDGGSAARRIFLSNYTFFGQRLVLHFTSTYRHVKGDGSFPGRTKSMSCRGRLGCSCQSISSEGRARGGLSSPGRAGVYEWNTHSRPAKLAANLTPSPASRCVRSRFASPSCFAMSKN